MQAEEGQTSETILTLKEKVKGKTSQEKIVLFKSLEEDDAEELFIFSDVEDQVIFLSGMPVRDKKKYIKKMPPDDIADLMQMLDSKEQSDALALVNEATRREIYNLMTYEEDVAGGMMTPHFIQVRDDMTVELALKHVKMQARSKAEMVYYIYVIDQEGRLQGAISLRQLISAENDVLVRDLMRDSVIYLYDHSDIDEISRVFFETDLLAIPVVDENKTMKGIITFDDVFDAIEEEATKDIQKIGGLEALDESYTSISWINMVKKRAGWLIVLFAGETLTASAMSYYEHNLAQVVALAIFIPLIISSGGNSGSQASTLVIRALAVGEVEMRDWFRIFRRELSSGALLGLTLGIIGCLKIYLVSLYGNPYGEYYMSLAFIVGISLLGVVLWGTVCGSMLPLVLKKLNFDPATASAPLVATVVDVTGIIIYFSVAQLILGQIIT